MIGARRIVGTASESGRAAMFERAATDILSACREGRLPPGVGLMHLAMASTAPEQVEQFLTETREAGALLALWRRRPDFWSLAKALQGIFEIQSTECNPGAISDAFDRAAAHSPDAACALYALGDVSLLEDATAEVVGEIEAFLSRRTRVLDIGCGAGRFEVALASRVQSILGLEASSVMAETARRRCAGLANVEIALCESGAPPALAPASFEFVLAIDSFPYILQCGGALATGWFEAAACALTSGGRFVILNFSYRKDPLGNQKEAARLGRAVGLRPVALGATPFRQWDGALFHFVKD